MGPMGALQPTGKWITMRGVSINRFNAEHRCISLRVIFDGDLLLRKMRGEVEDDQREMMPSRETQMPATR